MNPTAQKVRDFYGTDAVVTHYARAASRLGLWASEELLARRFFRPDKPLLELGCGAGRFALGLAGLGWGKVTATDFSPALVDAAREVGAFLGREVNWQVADATALPFADAEFAGAVFAFNGLVQIPGRSRRRQALGEILRVLQPGSSFLFSTHDRERSPRADAWKAEALARQASGGGEGDFGDRWKETPWGRNFIHVPNRQEVMEDLASAGWEWVEDHWRPELASESAAVREFADDCRLWVARKPL